MATIKDIARNLGISYATVSLALNDSPKVKQETRKKVVAEAQRLGYYRNTNARALVLRKTMRVGVIVPSILHPFFAEMLLAAQRVLNQRGYDILICNTNMTPELESHYLRLAIGGQVDGLVVTTLDFENPLLSQLINDGFPLVFINNTVQNKKVNYVGTDSELGGFLGGQHLLAFGHRKIAYLGAGMHTYINAKRYQGFKRALEGHGISHDPGDFYNGFFTIESGREMAQRLLDDNRGVTAVFASSDFIAVGALGFLREQGIRVPEECSVIGFDDAYFSGFPGIDLTTVYQDKVLIGETATTMLLNTLEQATPPDRPKKVILKPHLVVRNSTRRLE